MDLPPPQPVHPVSLCSLGKTSSPVLATGKLSTNTPQEPFGQSAHARNTHLPVTSPGTPSITTNNRVLTMDSSNTQKKQGEEQEFSIQPIKDNGDSNNSSAAAHNANPGPVIPKEMPEQEGTAQDRKDKMETLNK